MFYYVFGIFGHVVATFCYVFLLKLSFLAYYSYPRLDFDTGFDQGLQNLQDLQDIHELQEPRSKLH